MLKIQREPLTDYETTKARLAEIRRVEAKLRAEAEQKEAEEAAIAGPHVVQRSKKKRGGQNKKADSKRATAASVKARYGERP
jgi:hypothetical protein